MKCGAANMTQNIATIAEIRKNSLLAEDVLYYSIQSGTEWHKDNKNYPEKHNNRILYNTRDISKK